MALETRILRALAETATGRYDPAMYMHPPAPAAWLKHGVLFEPDEPWETEDIANPFSTVERTADGAWRLWYHGVDRAHPKQKHFCAVAEGSPEGGWKRHRIETFEGDPPGDALYAVGGVPAGWNITQPVHFHLEHLGRHRLYFWAHTDRVHRYLAAESDDGRRYRVLHRPLLYHAHDHSVPRPFDFMGLSIGGKRAPDTTLGPAAPPERVTNDATNVYRLPDGTFELYTAALESVPEGDPRYVAHDNAKGWIRVIDRFTSEDGLHFSDRRRVIARDADDPPDRQFYGLTVIPTARGRVGLIHQYPCAAQTMEIEWAFSEDGVSWQRGHRDGWLPRARPGEAVDSYRVYPPGNVIEHDGRWWLFYTGCNFAHNRIDCHGDTRRRRLMLATIDRLFE